MPSSAALARKGQMTICQERLFGNHKGSGVGHRARVHAGLSSHAPAQLHVPFGCSLLKPQSTGSCTCTPPMNPKP
jgi:hypothetical protein